MVDKLLLIESVSAEFISGIEVCGGRDLDLSGSVITGIYQNVTGLIVDCCCQVVCYGVSQLNSWDFFRGELLNLGEHHQTKERLRGDGESEVYNRGDGWNESMITLL